MVGGEFCWLGADCQIWKEGGSSFPEGKWGQKKKVPPLYCYSSTRPLICWVVNYQNKTQVVKPREAKDFFQTVSLAPVTAPKQLVLGDAT